MTRHIDLALEQAGLAPLERFAWVEVDVDILVSNAGALRDLAAPSSLAPVVKADGYGHGLEMAARCAVAAGAGWLCVADSAEAGRLRRDGYQGRVFVLYPVPGRRLATMAKLGVDVTVGDVAEARSIDDHLGPDHPELAVHLEIDTGMTRGGVPPDDAIAAAGALIAGSKTILTGVWTHLSAPEDESRSIEQMAVLGDVLTRLANAGIDPGLVHAAASGGLLATDTGSQALVRPGLAFYGVHPGAGRPLSSAVVPALAVRAHPVRLARVPAGTAVGYAGTWATRRVSTIATLPIGYADGWSRSSSPGTWALVEGGRAPVVGRVSSDSLTVDVTDVPDVGPHSVFTLLGRAGDDEITADQVAEARGTISWEVLQQLGGRLARIYTSGGTPVAIRAETTTEIIISADSHVPSH